MIYVCLALRTDGEMHNRNTSAERQLRAQVEYIGEARRESRQLSTKKIMLKSQKDS